MILKSAEQLAYLMVPLSVAALAYKVATAAFHVRYLTLPEQQRDVAIGVATIGLGVTVILMLGGGFSLFVIAPHLGLVIVSSGLITYALGTYFMAVTALISEEEAEAYGAGRLLFGVLNIASTFVSLVFIRDYYGLVLATAVTNFVTALWMAQRTSLGIRGLFGGFWRRGLSTDGARYAWQSRSVVSSTLVSDLGVQIQGLLTPLMGPHKEIWAIVVRISGGFGSLGQQIIAPNLELKTASAVRKGNSSEAVKWARLAQFGGFGFAAATVVVQTIVLLILYSESVSVNSPEVWLCALYSLGLLSSALTMKTPYILGNDREMFYWSIVRLVLTAPLITLHDTTLLGAMAVVQLVVSILLAIITLCPAGRRTPPKGAMFQDVN
ncbi:hypothetical protein [Corynebacterium auriscanis]|uniref:hypothetical protein n=1 Tax=Corynebacterium auriscanis TaxID=99807 RepID=UPI003CED37C2